MQPLMQGEQISILLEQLTNVDVTPSDQDVLTWSTALNRWIAQSAPSSGGIITESLGTSGYVRFANGFTLQWGWESGIAGTTTALFPLAYTTTYSIVDAPDNYANYTGISNVTTTGFDHTGTAVYNIYWISTGVV